MPRTYIYIAVCFILCSLSTTGQSQTFAIGEHIGFTSQILNGQRDLWVHVPDIEPDGLATPQTLFPVIYVLDGEHNFLNTVGISQALARAGLMPKVMVVGISGSQREYDYSPSDINVEYMETGGGVHFLPFLSNEIIPYINQNYPSSNHNTLIGHSIGALFCLYALIESSDSISGFLSISPSLWWDNESLAEQWERTLMSYAPGQVKKVFMTMANERTLGKDGQTMHDRYLSFKSTLGDRDKFNIGFMDLFDEDHLSTVTPATHYGLKFLYRDWNLDRLYASHDFKGLKKSLSVLSETYRFQVAPSYAQLVGLGRHFHNSGDFETALEVYEVGLSSYPEGLQLLGFAAQSHLENGDVEKAREYFEKGLERANFLKSPMTSWFKDHLQDIGN